MNVIPLFSGSSGNSVYIKSGDDEILIDAGVSCKALTEALIAAGSEWTRIKCVLVTHEHTDHICGLELISKKYKIPVYINSASAQAVRNDKSFSYLPSCMEIREAGETVSVGNLTVKIFKTPHDSFGSVGYRITDSDGHSAGYATDIGYVTEEIAKNLFGCETVIVESNHDIDMLKKGKYPFFLKKRILSNTGHLSNADCAKLLPYLAKYGTKNIILAHLSKDNNDPKLAYETAKGALCSCGYSLDEIKLSVASRR